MCSPQQLLYCCLLATEDVTWLIGILSDGRRNRLSTHIYSSFKTGAVSALLNSYPRESEGICFHRRWFVCVSVCLSKTIVDGFAPNFLRMLGEKEH